MNPTTDTPWLTTSSLAFLLAFAGGAAAAAQPVPERPAPERPGIGQQDPDRRGIPPSDRPVTLEKHSAFLGREVQRRGPMTPTTPMGKGKDRLRETPDGEAKDAASRPDRERASGKGLEPRQDGQEQGQDVLGTSSDLLISQTDGTVQYLVLESRGVAGQTGRPVGGEEEGAASSKIAVPWHLVKWHSADKRFSVHMTEEEIERLPPFDPKNPGALRGERNARGAKTIGERSGGAPVREQPDARPVPAGTKPQDPAAMPAGSHGSLVPLSEVDDCQVRARTEALGACGDIYVEPRSGTVAFVSLTVSQLAGGSDATLLIPWHSLTHTKAARESVLVLTKDRESLAQAPNLGDDDADVNSAAFRARVYSFFAAPAPQFEPTSARPVGRDPGSAGRK